jgi:phosphoglycerol transferase MdoB-like AlkP superfamily enzyme
MTALLTPAAVKVLLAGVPLSVAWLTLALRRFGPGVRAPARLTVEYALVLAVFALALALQYLVLASVPLDAWAPFAKTVLNAAALVALPLALVPARFRGRAFGAYLVLLVALSFGDVIYLRYFGNVLPVLAFRSGTQVWDVRDVIVDYTRPSDIWFVPALFTAVLASFAWPARRPLRGTLAAIEALLFVGVAGLTAYAAWPVRAVVETWLQSERSYRVLNGTDAVQDNGYIVAHLKEASRSFRSLREHTNLSPSARARIERFHAERASAPPQTPDYGIARGTNLLIVQVEGMQEWAIGARYAGQEITPFLNRLRQRALYFSELFDETGDSSTSDAEYMLYNSQFPLNVGSVAFRRAENHFVTLLHAFKDARYTTFAGHAYAAGMWNRAVLYPRYGFDRAAFQPEFGAGPKLGWGIGDKPFVERAVPMLARLPQPFVGFLVTLTSHGPFQYVPMAERKLSLGSIETTDFGGYLHSMRYEDESIELLFEKLAAKGLLENTTVVVYGDHDSRLRFPAFLADNVELAPETSEVVGGQRSLVQRIAQRDFTTKRIPLFILLPQKAERPGGTVRTLGGHVDVGPTLLYLYGLPRPRSFIGQSLLPERPGHALRVDGSAVDSNHIYIAANGGRCESYPQLERKPMAECDALAKAAREELDVSWSVTLSDLASELSGKRPTKTRAER